MKGSQEQKPEARSQNGDTQQFKVTQFWLLTSGFWFLFLASSPCSLFAQSSPWEAGIDVTGVHLHKIDETPIGIGGRIFLNFNENTSLDAEVTHFGKTTALLGIKSGLRASRFGVFGKGRGGMWHFRGDLKNVFSMDVGSVLEYYPSPRTTIRIDAGDTILFYGGTPGTVHNFQPGLGFSFRF